MQTLQDNYILGDTLSQGNNCNLFRAKRKHDGLDVIIKRSRKPADRLVSDGLRKAFLFTKNGRIPRSITSLSIEEDGENTSLVILDEGLRSLDQVWQEVRRLAPRLEIALAMAEAIAAVHAAGLIHGDIKPSNFLYRLEPLIVQLTDFDAARFAHQEPQNRLHGTPAYMSPEQTGKLQRNLDRRSDFYSLGVSLYQLFSGRLPFQLVEPEEILAGHLQTLPDPLPSELPSTLRRLIMKLLEKEPLLRYQSAEGICSDLRRIAEDSTLGFELGESDIPFDFNWPIGLVGRDHELNRLYACYHQACQGHSVAQTVFVSGTSGIGKTSLLSKIRFLANNNGSLIGLGKFDQFDRSKPYSALKQALTQIQQQMLTLPDHTRNSKALRVREELGSSFSTVASFIPSCQVWLGDSQERPEELRPIEARERLFEGLVRFLAPLGSVDSPLVLIVDDLQWADLESLSLLKFLASNPQLPHLLLLGAYRSDEVETGHPLMHLKVETLALKELTAEQMTSLLQQVTLNGQAECAQLAELLARKTLGNPYYVRQFLQSMREQKLLFFQNQSTGHLAGASSAATQERSGHGCWSWELEPLAQIPITTNVLPMVQQRVELLPSETLQALQQAACLGASFQLGMLAELSALSTSATWDLLLPALQQELICADGDSSRMSFSHDSVQQVVCVSLPTHQLALFHARAGRVFRRNDQIIEAVNHLNLGRLALDPDEQDKLHGLNLDAARLGMRSSSYEFAASCLAQITNHWDSSLAKQDRRFALEVYQNQAETFAYLNEQEKMQFCLACAAEHIETTLDRVKLIEIQLFYDINRIQWEAVLDSGYQALKLLGHELPEQPDDAVVGAELGLTLQTLGGMQVAEILALKNADDPADLAAARVLKAISAAAYFSRPNVYPIVVLRIARLALSKGLCAESAAGFLGLGVVHAALLGDYVRAEQLGKIAQAIEARFQAHHLSGYLAMVYHAFIHHWNHPLKESLESLGHGADAALASGDTEFWSYCWYWQGAHAIYTGQNLPELRQRLHGQCATIERRQQKKGRLLLHLYHALESLIGDKNLGTPDGDLDEAELEALWAQASDWNGLSYSRGFRALAHFYLGEYDACEQLVSSCEPFTPYLLGQSYFSQVSFFQAISRLRLGRLQDDEIEPLRAQWKKWSEACPANYRHKNSLILAEIARKNGEVPLALSLYLQAGQEADVSGFRQDVAWSHQSIGEMYLTLGDQLSAAAHFGRSAELYLSWGALAVASRVNQKAQSIQGHTKENSGPAAFTTLDANLESLDLAALLKASRSLTEMEEVPKILEQVMHLLLQNSGATHGRLWLSEDKFDGLPESLIVYVSRSQEVVIVNESIGETPFARDAYFSNHHPRSLLCCPLVLHNRLLGVLYLENDLLSYVFSVERLKAVQLIALQAAISIEIWRQFERVQAQQLEILEERDRRNREVLRVEALQGQNRALASFLGIASHDLQTPLAVIRMWSQNFKPGISDKLLLRCRQILEQSVEQATTLIQSYLDAVVAELGQKLVLRIQSVDLTELIRSEVEFHQTSQGLPSLALSQLILEPVTADVDPLRMRQILRNLVQNALNHSSEGTYSVRLFRQDNQICLDVSNPCQPLSEEQKGRLFQAFQPGESSQGRGLGLWICRTLVEAHAGQISAVQDPGRGIVFQVRIPYQ